MAFKKDHAEPLTGCRVSVGNCERWAAHNAIQRGVQDRLSQLLR